MKAHTLLNADEVKACISDSCALDLLRNMRHKGLEYSSVGRIDPTQLTPKQQSCYAKATLSSMQKKFKEVLDLVTKFLFEDNDPEREISENEYYTLNMLLILCEGE